VTVRPRYSSARPSPIGSTSPPASATRSATEPVSGTIHTPSTAAWPAPARTARLVNRVMRVWSAQLHTWAN